MTMIEWLVVMGVIAGFVLFTLAVLIPVNVYLAQRNASRCFDELRDLNARLKIMAGQIKAANESMAFLAEMEANKLGAGQAREVGRR